MKGENTIYTTGQQLFVYKFAAFLYVTSCMVGKSHSYDGQKIFVHTVGSTNRGGSRSVGVSSRSIHHQITW